MECAVTTHNREFSREESLEVAFAADTPTDDKTVDLLRFCSPSTGERLYTTYDDEAILVRQQGEHRYEGVITVVCTSQGEGLLPVCRYYNYADGKHFLPASLCEGNELDRTI